MTQNGQLENTMSLPVKKKSPKRKKTEKKTQGAKVKHAKPPKAPNTAWIPRVDGGMTEKWQTWLKEDLSKALRKFQKQEKLGDVRDSEVLREFVRKAVKRMGLI